MSFNVQKCMYLRITNKLHPYVHDYFMNDIHIQQVEHAKYLGIIIDKNLTWSEHVKKAVNKANSVRGFLQRNFTKCPLPIKSSCYLSLVRPRPVPIMLEILPIILSRISQKFCPLFF